MQSSTLDRNPNALMVTLVAASIFTFILASIGGVIVGAFFNLIWGSSDWMGLLTFLIIIFVCGFVMMLVYAKWDSVQYELTPEAIVVTSKIGALGKKQKVYLYQSIISVSFNQNIFGRKYGYGDVHITIPKLEKKLVLKDVDNPAGQLPYLQERIKSKTTGSHNVLVT